MSNHNLLYSIQQYNYNPSSFSVEEIESLEKRALAGGLPFSRQQQSYGFNIGNTVNQLMSGFASGFTTLHVGDDPLNEAEHISRNIGHLLGLIGFIPGPGLFASSIIKGAGLTFKAAKAAKLAAGATKITGAVKGTKAAKAAAPGVSKAAQYFRETGRLGQTKYGFKLPSIPMVAADLAAKVVGKKLGASEALNAYKYFKEGTIGRQMLRQGAHLGTALAVSSWQEGVDGMMTSFGHGAVAGTAFAGIGNIVKLKGLMASSNPKNVRRAETIVKGLSGAMFTGIPATLADQPTSIQIYEYLLGAYFGGMSMPASMEYAGKRIKSMTIKDWEDPPKMKDWDNIPKESQDIILHEQILHNERLGAMIMARSFAEEGILDPPQFGKITKGKHKDKMLPIDKETAKGFWLKEGDRNIWVKKEDIDFDIETLVRPPTPKATPKDVHEAAKKAGMEWDDDATFMALSKKVTGKDRIDDMTSEERINLISEIETLSKDAGFVTIEGPAEVKQEMQTISEKNNIDPQEIMDGVPARSSGMGAEGEKGMLSVAELSNEVLADKLSRMEKSEQPQLEAARKGDPTAITAYWANQKTKQNIINAIGFDPRPTPPTKVVEPKSVEDVVTTKSGVTYYKSAYGHLSKQYDKLSELVKNTINIVGKKKGEMLWNKFAVWYGDVDYTYTGVTHKMQKMPAEFEKIARDIEKKLGVEKGYFNSALVNIFPKGQKLGRHADDEPIFVRDNKTIGKVATISLGGSTDITISNNKTGKTDVIRVKDGDMYVMPGQKFQIENKHAVGKASGNRISMTFRHIPKSRLPKKLATPTKESLAEAVKPRPPIEQTDTSFQEAVADHEQPSITTENLPRNKEKREINSIIEDQLVVRDNKLEQRGEVDILNKRVIKSRHSSFLERIIGESRSVLEFSEIDGKQEKILKGNLPDFMIANIFIDADALGKYYFSGVKDKDRMIFIKHQVENPKDYIDRYLDEMDILGYKNSRGLYASRFNEFKTLISKSFQGKEILAKPDGNDIVAKMYDKAMGSNIYMMEKINGGVHIETILANPDKFITNPVEFNKRMQIIDAGEPGLEKSFYTHLKDIENGLNISIINAIPSKGGIKRNVLHKQLIKDLGKIHKAHLDGIFVIRDDVFSAMIKDGGFPSDATLLKGVLSQPDPELGAVFGKYAYFKAGKTESKEMMGHQMHGKLYDTAAKQLGFRKKFDMQVNKRGKTRYFQEGTKKEIDPEKYLIDFENMSLNMSNYENPQKEALKNATLVRQSLNNLFPEQIESKIIRKASDQMIFDAIKGDKDTNSRVDRYLKTGDESLIADIEIENISLSRIIDIIGGKNKTQNSLFERIQREIMNLEDKDPDLYSIDDFDGTFAEIFKEQQEFVTQADRILKLAKLTPATVGFKWVLNLHDDIVRQYVIRRIIKPVIPFSGKAKGYPFDYYLQRRMDLQPGEFYLGDIWRSKKIQYQSKDASGKDIESTASLEQLFSVYSELSKIKNLSVKDKEKLDSLEKALDWLVIRVPSDSASGLRMLRFKGFTERGGSHIVLHPKDMEYLGGMDLDLDSVFLYQKFPRELGDAIKKLEYEWHKNKGKGRFIPVKNKDDEFLLKDVYEQNFLDSPFGLVDPLTRLKVSRGATDGNKLLGTVANARRRIHTLFSLANEKGYLELNIKSDEDLIIGKLKLIPAEDGGAAFREYARDAMNYAADAADYSGLKSGKKITELLLTKAFKSIDASLEPDGKPFAPGNDVSWTLAALNRTIYGKMRLADEAIGGYNYNETRRYTLDEVFKVNRDLVESLESEGLELPGSRIEQYKLLSNMEYNIHPNTWIDIKTLDANIKDVKKSINSNAELKERIFKKFVSFGADIESFVKPSEARRLTSEALALITSIKRINLASQKHLNSGGTVKELEIITDNVERFKLNYTYLLGDKNARGRISGKYIPKHEILDSLNKAVENYVKTLSKTEKSFFDEWLLGNLFKQNYKSLSDYKNKLVERHKKSTDPEEKKRLFNMTVNAERDWFKTDLASFGFASKTTPDDTIKSWFKDYNSFAKYMGEPKGGSKVKEILGIKLSDNPEINKAVKVVNMLERPQEAQDIIENIVESMPELKSSWKKESWGLAKKKLPKHVEIEKAMEEFKWILNKHPEILDRFPKMFAGITHVKTPSGQRDLTVGAFPEIANYKDLQNFFHYFKMVHGRNYLKAIGEGKDPPALKKWSMYQFPETISKQHLQTDLNSFLLKKAPVKGPDGKIYKTDVYIPFSHHGRIEITAKTAVGQADNAINKTDKQREDNFLILEELGSDGLDLFAFASYKISRGLSGWVDTPVYENLYQKARINFDKNYAHKNYSITKDGMKKQVTAEETVDIIIESLKKTNEDFYKTWLRDDDKFEKFITRRKDNNEINFNKTISDVGDLLFQGKSIPIATLNNSLRLAHEYMLSRTLVKHNGESTIVDKLPPDLMKARMNVLRKEFEFKPIGELPFEFYFPQNGHLKKSFDAHVEKRLKEMEDKGATESDMIVKRMELINRMNQEISEDAFVSVPISKFLGEEGGVSLEAIQEIGLHKRPGHSLRRNLKDPIPDWDRTPDSYKKYQSQIIKGYYNILTGLTSHRAIEHFTEFNAMGKHTQPWARFMRMYARDILGYPSVIPEEWLDDPRFPLKGTLANVFSDQTIARRLNKISKKWFGGKKFWEDTNDLYYKLSHYSNLEAKWELMTLLTHTKTMANNMMGGTVNSVVSSGYRHWRNASPRNFAYLSAKIPAGKGKEWKSYEDFHIWVERHGGSESFLRSELNANAFLRTKRGGRFISELILKLKKDPEINKADVFEIGRRHGITQALLENSASFMRIIERRLRTRAFLAHYLSAAEAMETNGLAFERDDPILIQMAMKGVEGTQYLYNNAARPAFARTPMGRVFSRFQLWAWNSLRFRKNIYQNAKAAGFSPDTPEFERFRRLATADLFMFSLTAIFPASIFESTLPPPWSYVQDMSDLMFGNEEDRDRAFYGTLPAPLSPLQAISPPVARFIMQPLGNLLKGDWSRFASYQIWTWFPYGRIARDIKGTIESPVMIIERSTGLPIHRIHKYVRDLREEEVLGDSMLESFEKAPNIGGYTPLSTQLPGLSALQGLRGL